MGRLSTHVLDTTHGRPASGLTIELLEARPDGGWQALKTVTTNAEGARMRGAWPGRDALGPLPAALSCRAYFRRIGLIWPIPPFSIRCDRVRHRGSGGHYHARFCAPVVLFHLSGQLKNDLSA